jgi:hypothetical protein
MLKKILIGLVVVIALFGIFVVTRPNTYHVERTVEVQAPVNILYEQLDLNHFSKWSPWERLDPNLKKTVEGPPLGVGQKYAWTGNDQVGEGAMTLTDVKPLQVSVKVEFFKPFPSVSNVLWTITPGDKSNSMTWGMDGEMNTVMKAMCIFMPMDKMIGPDFERGLQNLKTIAEAQAKARVEAAVNAAAVDASAKGAADAAVNGVVPALPPPADAGVPENVVPVAPATHP